MNIFKVLRDLYRIVGLTEEQEGTLYVVGSGECTFPLSVGKNGTHMCYFADSAPIPDPCNPVPPDECTCDFVWLGRRWGLRIKWTVAKRRKIRWTVRNK
jgi:hypothetical protein